jgi:hypothetical protein
MASPDAPPERDNLPEEDQPGGIAGSAIGDHPTHADRLGFKPYVEAIAGFLLADATRPPITISIEGEWGSGKSSFLLQLEDAIVGERRFDAFLKALPLWCGGESTSGSLSAAWKKLRGPRPPLTVRFNAWRHDKQDSVWAAFALAFVQSLRSEIGFVRAYLGDLKLFLKRLTGFRGWLQLILLALSALLFVVGFAALSIYILRLAPDDLKTLLNHILYPNHETSGMAFALTSIATHGAWGAVAAVGFAGIYKFHAHFKMPLSLNLEKYLAKPDYSGHVTFIESFHEDLKRLIHAYAGRERVFIFVDDLDRCDVPRAAELMQAINLMIGDAGNLVFILGMDREKVAAGVALKYKDLFPFLRESAQWKPGENKDDVTPLYFGYAYLEKFIQISFSLPIPNDGPIIQEFLNDRPVANPRSWPTRLAIYWMRTLMLKSLSFSSNPVVPLAAAAIDLSTQPLKMREKDEPTPEPVNTEYHRVEIKEDSDRIRKIVVMVTELFENNPRRLKQFVNTFRLALYIASDQGLFDRSDRTPGATTPEQLGKFCALLLRFPDLRFKLIQNTNFLIQMEKDSLSKTAQSRWLEARGARDLLALNVGPDVPPATRNRYSLEYLDITRLITILPRAARPPARQPIDLPVSQPSNAKAVDPADSGYYSTLLRLAREYEQVRGSQPASDKRTLEMTNVFERGRQIAQKLSPVSASMMLDSLTISNEPGDRLMCLAIAYERVDHANLRWLLPMLDHFLSRFEHYWCIETMLRYVAGTPANQKAQIVDTLNRHWDEIQRDTGRVRYAEQLRQRALGNTARDQAPKSAPPPQPKMATETQEESNDEETRATTVMSEELLVKERIETVPRPPRQSQQKKIAPKKK